jgi:glucosamine-6-phosphate deaminase
LNIHINRNSNESGQLAAEMAAVVLRECIQEKGKARVVLSTGASQFKFFEHFIKQSLDWSVVEVFHLDEYINLPESHPASFRKYLKERFAAHVNLGKAHWVNGEQDSKAVIQTLSEAFAAEEIDLGMIGIGENGHIAFNDPPAEFETKAIYKVVNLDEECKRQQRREGCSLVSKRFRHKRFR